MSFEDFQDGWQPPWTSLVNDISSSESPGHSDASHQVSAQTDLPFESIWFEDFQDGCCSGYLGYLNKMILAILNLHGYGSHLGYGTRKILAVLNLHVVLMKGMMPPFKFHLKLTYSLGGNVV